MAFLLRNKLRPRFMRWAGLAVMPLALSACAPRLAGLESIGGDFAETTLSSPSPSVSPQPSPTPSAVAPSVSITTPASDGAYVNAANQASFAVAGTCSLEGTSVALVAGSVSATASCTAGVFSATLNLSGLAEGAISLQAAQTSAQSLTGTATRSLNKNTDLPTLVFGSTNPASPDASASPRVIGTTSADTATVRIYLGAACDAIAASGTKSDFEGAGILVNVPAGVSSALRAIAVDVAGNASGCTALATYANSAALAGTYRIKPDGSGEFTTLALAVSRLMAQGQSGAVVFDVYAGSYPGTLTLGAVTGNSSTNTITLRKAATAGGAVTTEGITVNGPSYVTIQGFDTIAGQVQFTGGSTYGVVQDAAIVVPTGGTGVVAAWANHGFTARRLAIDATSGASGIAVLGPANNVTIESNQIIGLAAGAATGEGISFRDWSWGFVSGLGIRNNVIRGGFAIGIAFNGNQIMGEGSHNTVRLHLDNSMVFSNSNAWGGFQWRNNIWAHYGGATGTAIYSTGGGSLNSNYNLFYAPNGAPIADLGKVTLADWRVGTNVDLQSAYADPKFVSATDLRIGDDSPAQGRGFGGIGPAADILGASRSGSAPDCGAYENTNASTAPGPMAGTYTVKADGTGNYVSVAAAGTDLEARGQSGPVTFEVYAGTYSAAMQFGPVPGNSVANAITVKKAASEAGMVQLSGVQVYKTHGVTVQGFDHIVGSVSFLAVSTYPVVQDTSITTVGSGSGLFFSSGSDGLIVRRTVIDASSGGSGIQVMGAPQNATIERNRIFGNASGPAAGWGIGFFDYGWGFVYGVSIRNNMIYGGFQTGIHFIGNYFFGEGQHNSIRMHLDDSVAIRQDFGNGALTWRNNILAHYGTTTAGAIFACSSTIYGDYNLFHAPNGAPMGSCSRVSLADWQADRGQDSHSVAADPGFVSATDLHLTGASSALGIGTNLGVAEDYDGQARGATPDIGADEI